MTILTGDCRNLMPARTVRRKKPPPHTGRIDAGHYVSEDGGPRLMRSVTSTCATHGRSSTPRKSPSSFLEILIRTAAARQPGRRLVRRFSAAGEPTG